jgi:ATP-binding cassette subfamily B protein
MAVEVLADIAQPALMSDIIDVGVVNGDISYIVSKGKVMVLYALAGLAGGYLCSVFSAIGGSRFGANVRRALFNKITTLSYREIDNLTTSSLITRMTNDVTQTQQMVMTGLRGIRAPFLCIGGLVASYLLSPRLALIFLVAVPLLAIAVAVIIVKALPLFAQTQGRLDRVNTVMRENLLGVKVVKAFTGEERENKRFFISNLELKDWSLKSSYLTILLNPVSTFVMNMSIIALYWFGGNMAAHGQIESGKIMAMLTYMTLALMSLMQLMMMLTTLSRALVSAKRINAVMDTEPRIKEAASPELPADSSISFENVSFRYNDTDPEFVLKDVCFTAKSGETVGVIGTTGSGKSTLVSLIPRLYEVTKGQVKIGGTDVRKIPRKFLSQFVGMTLQENVLFAGTIRENLRWGNETCDFSEIERSASDAQATEFILSAENGYDSQVEQRGKNFSGGQKQRLCIARTLARGAKILIFDDSTSALDTETDRKIQKALSKLSDTTVFIIAQRISSIMHSDKIIVMDEGKIESMGKHEELIKNSRIYRQIAVSQLGEAALT